MDISNTLIDKILSINNESIGTIDASYSRISYQSQSNSYAIELPTQEFIRLHHKLTSIVSILKIFNDPKSEEQFNGIKKLSKNCNNNNFFKEVIIPYIDKIYYKYYNDYEADWNSYSYQRKQEYYYTT